jgi:hypothetical protein
MFDQLQIALERERRVLAGGVERSHEDAKAEPVVVGEF